MKISIATCAHKPNLLPGDQLLQMELEKIGINSAPLVWSEGLPQDSSAILIRSVWDYYRRPLEFQAWLKAACSNFRLLNSAHTILWNFDKGYLQELNARGLACVPSLVIKQGERGAAARVRAMGWERIVIKPTISGAAYLTFLSSSLDPKMEEQIKSVQAHSDCLAQPYLPSVGEMGEVSLIYFRAKEVEYSHAVLKTPKAGDFRVQSDFGGALLPFTPSDFLIESGAVVLEAVPGEWVFARLDFLDWHTENPLIGEVEVIEPDLFLEFSPEAPRRFARVLAEVIG